MDNKEYFTGLREQFKNGKSRDFIVKRIKNDYCAKVYFKDNFDKMRYIVDLCSRWGLFKD
jgi:pimeloyl-CoA synthetase